jgi:superfamily II DNA helicase RecQ
MAEQMPQNKSEFGLLTGVGERKLEKYSEAFLAVIQEAL